MKRMKTYLTFFTFAFTIKMTLSFEPIFRQSFPSEASSQSSIIDLGQDKTDAVVPKYLRLRLITNSFESNLNQYFPPQGEERALKAVAALYSKVLNHELKYDENIIMTAGASEALCSTLSALTKPGDEWIIIEPFWGKYTPLVEIAGGVPRYTALTPLNTKGKVYAKDWKLNRMELERLFNNKTRGIILNNPHNPTGKVFSLKDLKFIANLSNKYNTLVIADEVFEWVVFKPTKFINFVSLPDMFNRTITIGSASKAFLVSGWRIGWAYGPQHLINNIKKVHAAIMISTPTLTQDVIAQGLELELKYFGTPQSFFHYNSQTLKEKRNLIIKAFTNAKMTPYIPDSGDCLIVKLPKTKTFNFDFIRNDSHYSWFTNHSKVLGFPMKYFYSNQSQELGKDSMRFCFQKKISTIQKAEKNFLSLATAYF